MRVIVTGGAGFIGSAVVRLAVAQGHTVMVIDALTYAACVDNLSSVAAHPNYAFRHLNIIDGPAMLTAFREFQPDVLMHLAAESHVDRSIDAPGDFVDTNVTGTLRLLEAARQWWTETEHSAFRFHHVSTDEVFGSLGPDGKFSEASAYDPRSPYAASKAASDHLVRAWGETYGLPYVLSNCSNNYGPYQFPEKLIPVVILNALQQAPIPIYGQGQNIRDWLHVDDHADALLTIAKRGAIGATYLVGGHAERTNLDLVHNLCGILDELRPQNAPHSDLISFVVDRPGHDARYAIDARKIEDDLGWRSRIGLDDGLRQTVRWYLDNRDWWERLQNRTGVGRRLGLGPAKG